MDIVDLVEEVTRGFSTHEKLFTYYALYELSRFVRGESMYPTRFIHAVRLVGKEVTARLLRLRYMETRFPISPEDPEYYVDEEAVDRCGRASMKFLELVENIENAITDSIDILIEIGDMLFSYVHPTVWEVYETVRGSRLEDIFFPYWRELEQVDPSTVYRQVEALAGECRDVLRRLAEQYVGRGLRGIVMLLQELSRK